MNDLLNRFDAWSGSLPRYAFISILLLAGLFIVLGYAALDEWLEKREQEKKTIRDITENRCPRCGHPTVPGAEEYHRRRCIGRLKSQRNYKIGKGEGFDR